VSWCIGFAVLATAVAMAAARLLLGRHLSALMTVAVLAGWSQVGRVRLEPTTGGL
jgi:hypothetical protein